MTELKARCLLRKRPGVGLFEAWIAEQPWQTVPGGWPLVGERQGWRFKVETISGGLRISAGEPGAAPAVWTVTARPLCPV